MPITSDQAVAIARDYGLGLADALSLKHLADSPDEARRIAEQFAVPSLDNQFLQAMTTCGATADTATSDGWTIKLSEVTCELGLDHLGLHRHGPLVWDEADAPGNEQTD